MDTNICYLSTEGRRLITSCNHNYSKEGIFHPDRIMEEYDLLYMRNGTWQIYEEENCYQLGSHHLLLLEPGKHHYSLERCTPEMKNIYIHFSALSNDKKASPSSLQINKHLDCSSNRSIEHTMEQILETFWVPQTQHKDFRLSALLDVLLSELAHLSSATTSSNDLLIEEIIHRFHSTPERFFSPEELANSYQISLRSLSGRFKRATGQAIHQYQLRLKLNIAYDLLPLSPGRSLRDIALSLGFYDEFQFSRLFKRQFGMPPSNRRDAVPYSYLIQK